MTGLGIAGLVIIVLVPLTIYVTGYLLINKGVGPQEPKNISPMVWSKSYRVHDDVTGVKNEH